ncbi:MAG: nucleoside 2-deoxyribosyltransferase [Candidatus Aenigmarchaeota archaeon]|nr:nucleoside 2-deoxyribosyltransferase [Candidatus Aenigmarchaeota archaeon]
MKMREKKKTAQVYISGSLIHTPMSWWKIYEKIGKVVEEAGMKPYVPHLNTANAVGFTDKEIIEGLAEHVVDKVFDTDNQAVENSDIIVAEVSNPSLGSGIEIGWALNKNKKIICLTNDVMNVTPLIRGAAKKGLIKLIEYDNEEEALNRLGEMLRVMKL